MAILILHPCTGRLLAADTDTMGEAVTVTADEGERVAERPTAPEAKRDRVWPWILGVVAAGAGGWWLADQLDETDTKNKDAAASADAAGAAASAAAASGAAADTAAASAGGAAAAEEPAYTVHLSGTFKGDEMQYQNAAFVPAISFSYTASGTSDGNVTGYRESGTNTVLAGSGTYKQVGDKSVLIFVNHEFYAGQCLVINQSTIKLENSRVLTAESGAGAYLISNQ
jgi:hypothetical protein